MEASSSSDDDTASAPIAAATTTTAEEEQLVGPQKHIPFESEKRLIECCHVGMLQLMTGVKHAHDKLQSRLTIMYLEPKVRFLLWSCSAYHWHVPVRVQGAVCEVYGSDTGGDPIATGINKVIILSSAFIQEEHHAHVARMDDHMGHRRLRAAVVVLNPFDVVTPDVIGVRSESHKKWMARLLKLEERHPVAIIIALKPVAVVACDTCK